MSWLQSAAGGWILPRPPSAPLPLIQPATPPSAFRHGIAARPFSSHTSPSSHPLLQPHPPFQSLWTLGLSQHTTNQTPYKHQGLGLRLCTSMFTSRVLNAYLFRFHLSKLQDLNPERFPREVGSMLKLHEKAKIYIYMYIYTYIL